MDTAWMRLLGIAGAALAVGVAALWLADGAWAHAGITPAAVQKQTDGVFLLAVPTEKANARASSSTPSRRHQGGSVKSRRPVPERSDA